MGLRRRSRPSFRARRRYSNFYGDYGVTAARRSVAAPERVQLPLVPHCEQKLHLKDFMEAYEPSKPYKQAILDLIRTTWETPYVSVRPGTHPIIQKKFSSPEVDHTDGIGTKGVYHWRAGTFHNAVIDSLAMNLNDLAVMRAVPYKIGRASCRERV